MAAPLAGMIPAAAGLSAGTIVIMFTAPPYAVLLLIGMCCLALMTYMVHIIWECASMRRRLKSLVRKEAKNGSGIKDNIGHGGTR